MQILSFGKFLVSDSQSHAGAIAGVVPFAIGAYEFGKRIVSDCTTTAAPSCCMEEAAAAHKLHTAALQCKALPLDVC